MPTETIEAPVESPFTIDLPDFDLSELGEPLNRRNVTGPWIVILYNCECHTFDEVEYILQKATGCSLQKAQAIAKEVDTKGRSICYSGEKEACEKVTAIIASIKLQVEMDRA